MLLWLVKFPKNHKPREIAYSCFNQVLDMCERYNIPPKKPYVRIIYFEEDDKVISFKQ